MTKKNRNNIDTVEESIKLEPKRKGLKLKKVNLDKLQKRFENIMDRHSRRLWEMVRYDELNKDQTTAVCNYLKLLKDLKKMEEESLEGMSDEELKKLLDKQIATK